MSTPRRQQISWALYDWGNSAFATTVLAGFFPIFFKQYWHSDVPAVESTFHLAVFNTVAGIVVALLAPILGAIADRAGRKKTFLTVAAIVGIAATAALAGVGSGSWMAAGLLFALGIVAFEVSLIFYDALLLDVSGPGEVDWVSALGYSLGYLGGGLLFAVNVAMTLKPEFFGLADASQAVKVSFVSVAVWWGVFTIPLLADVREKLRAPTAGAAASAVREGLRQIADTFREIRALRPVLLFLAAYIIYIDGVGTVIRMAVDFGLSIGFSSESLIIALLIVQFVGFPAALVFGSLGRRLGPRAGIFIGLGVYMFATIWGSQMTSVKEFYFLAILIGLVQGGVQSLSRSLYARLIPPDKSGEFFGFYNMLGKFAAIIGPTLMGAVSLLAGSTRAGMLSLVLLFLGGGALLTRVRVGNPRPEPELAKVG